MTYPLQKWEITNNNQLTIKEGETTIQTTSIEKVGDNKLIVKSLQLPELKSSDVSEQKTKQFRNSSLTDNSGRTVTDLIIAKYLEEIVNKAETSSSTPKDSGASTGSHKTQIFY